MSEPEFIPNSAPHAITMPVGSRNALSKSAVSGGPTTHDPLAEGDDHATEPSSSGEDWTAVDTAPPPPGAATPVENKRADIPVPQASEYAFAATPDLKALLSDELVMRLAALQSENAAVAHQLDGLETLMGSQAQTKPPTH